MYLPAPAAGVAPAKFALSAGLDYPRESASVKFEGPLVAVAGALLNFSLRFTGGPLSCALAPQNWCHHT